MGCVHFARNGNGHFARNDTCHFVWTVSCEIGEPINTCLVSSFVRFRFQSRSAAEVSTRC
ncbi:hypothetical protein HanRHA438_Chr14g0646761 [Helianthus annuus]|nr:hypothetical protein HanRHA438_Chr14g0646761 [Helianthus annuus]